MSRQILTILSAVAVLSCVTIFAPRALSQDVPRLELPRVGSQYTKSTRAVAQQLTAPIRALPPILDRVDQMLLPRSSSNPRRAGNGGCTHWIASVRHCKKNSPRTAGYCKMAFSRACSVDAPTPGQETEFRQWLQPGVPICIVIHGSYFPAADVASDCGQAVRWLSQSSPHVQYVCFTWPSEGVFTLKPGIAISSLVPALDVCILGRRAELNGIRLATFIQSLPAQSPVSIVAHSHGSRISSAALHMLAGGTIQHTRLRHLDRRRIRAVMVAAAIDHDWLNPTERYGKAISATECLLNLKSQYDWALGFYPLRRPFSRTALGRTGFTQRDVMRQGNRAQKVSELDVTRRIGSRHIFPFYYRHPSISKSLAPYVGFTE